MASGPLPPNSLFKSGILPSLVLHGIVIAASLGVIAFHPEYGVMQAPSSVEVQIVEEKPALVSLPETEKIITAVSESQIKIPVPKEARVLSAVEKEKVSVIKPEAGAVRKEAEAYSDNPAPVYPEKARLQGWEGLVILSVVVDEKGKAIQVHIQTSSGHAVLDEAAVKAIEKWRFKPAAVGKVRFTSKVSIPVRFKLTDR